MERRDLVWGDDRLSLQCQCDLLGISKSGLYYLPKGESDENFEIMKKMDKHHHDHPTYGVLQMQDYLFALGFIVNHKRVRRLMRKAQIMAQYPKRNLSKLGLAEYIYPYLLRNLNINHPNQVWEIDITYIPMDKGFMYLTAIIDVYSHFIVGWGLFITTCMEKTCLKYLRQQYKSMVCLRSSTQIREVSLPARYG